MAKAKNKNYIDKAEMYEEVVKSKEQGRATERLGEMFYKIAEKFSHHAMFRDYERRYGRAFKEDLLSAGVEACMKAWYKFDHEKFDNPFSFFTTCIYRANIGFLSTEYNYSNTKNAVKVYQGLRADYGYEEMIRESEVEDEEAIKAELAESEEPDEGDSEEEPTQDTEDDETSYEKYKNSQSNKNENVSHKGRVIKYSHLDDMKLWDYDPDEEEKRKKELTPSSKSDMFGFSDKG